MSGNPTQPVDVSVIVPAWKAADFIGRAVASALASEGVTLEVIVVDDASPDATFSVLQSLAAADPRVKADRLTENQGPSAARNLAIERASGRYVAILDADDTMAPGRLASLAALGDRTGAGIIVDNMIEVDEEGREFGDGPFLRSSVFTAAREIDLETWVRHNQPMQAGDCLGYLKPLFRRSMLIETGQRYDEDMRNSEDYYLVAHLLAGGARMTYTPESGYRYTRSPTSTSHRLSPAHTQAWLAAEQGFLARRGDKLTAGERQAQSARMRRLRDVHQFVGSVDAISKKNPAGFARALAADPTAWSFTLSWFAKIAWSKVAGRKAA